MTQTLEDRLSVIDQGDYDILRSALQLVHINPVQERHSMPYFKYELVNRIMRYLTQHSDTRENFGSALDVINKAPLKRTYYGIRSLGKIPESVLNALTNWQKIFFLTGRWEIKHPVLSEPGQVIVARHLLAGIENLYEQHFVRKAEGQYTRQLDIPEDSETREQARLVIHSYEDTGLTESETQEYDNITNLLKAEQGLTRNDLMDAQERTACALDRTSSRVLRVLSRKYSKEQLGDYYTKSR